MMSFPETGHKGLIVMQTCPCLFTTRVDLWIPGLKSTPPDSCVLFILDGSHNALEYVENIPSASLRGQS